MAAPCFKPLVAINWAPAAVRMEPSGKTTLVPSDRFEAAIWIKLADGRFTVCAKSDGANGSHSIRNCRGLPRVIADKIPGAVIVPMNGVPLLLMKTLARSEAAVLRLPAALCPALARGGISRYSHSPMGSGRSGASRAFHGSADGWDRLRLRLGPRFAAAIGIRISLTITAVVASGIPVGAIRFWLVAVIHSPVAGSVAISGTASLTGGIVLRGGRFDAPAKG